MEIEHNSYSEVSGLPIFTIRSEGGDFWNLEFGEACWGLHNPITHQWERIPIFSQIYHQFWEI